MYDGLKNLEVPRRSKHPKARRAARSGLRAFGVFLLVVAIAGIFLYKYVDSKLDTTKEKCPECDELLPDQPMNVLVLGSDRRDVLDKAELKEKKELRGPSGKRADTVILIHIGANAQRAVAISFPRDLRVQIPGRTGYHKLNAAYSFGGTRLMLRTIKQFSGIPIHHFVEVNFNSFRAIVNALGGVEVCVDRAYDDAKSGLKIAKPGCHNLEGDMALAYVRARNIDPRADLGRIERQQQFMRALMSKAKSLGVVLNPFKLLNVADAATEGLAISEGIGVKVGLSIARKLADNDKNVDFRVVPNTPRYIGGVSYVIAQEPASSRLFRAIIEDRERLPNVGKTGASVPRRKDVTVQILNGTGRAGLAREEGARLSKLGFTVVSVGNAKAREDTLIRFRPGADLKARLLEEEYPGTEVRVASRAQSADVVVILGSDFVEARASPSPAG